MDIKVLSTASCDCHSLADRAREAAGNAGVDAQVQEVTDMKEITRYGVMSTPALVIGGEVRASGRVPTVEEIEKLLIAS